jgi:hypothetical protein
MVIEMVGIDRAGEMSCSEGIEDEMRWMI